MNQISNIIIFKFIHNAWHGLIKYEDYLLIDKKIIKYKPSVGPSYLLIIKNIKNDKYYRITYTNEYKSNSYKYDKTSLDECIEVIPDKKETIVYFSEQEMLDDILKLSNELI